MDTSDSEELVFCHAGKVDAAARGKEVKEDRTISYWTLCLQIDVRSYDDLLPQP